MNEQAVREQPTEAEAEQAVLGAVLLDNAAFDTAAEWISPSDFASLRNSQIWARMRELRQRGELIDLVTLSSSLAECGLLDACGGRGYLADLSLVVASASQIRQHAELIRRAKLQRELIRLGTDLARSGYERQPPDEIIEQFSRRVFDIAWGRIATPWRSIRSVVDEAVGYVDTAMKRDGALIGWTTGLIELDRILGGFLPSDLVVIGARPSMGKTALACGMALSASASGAKVGFISLEMSRLQLGVRFLGYEGRVDVGALRTGRIRPDQWRSIAQASARLTERLVWLDDSGFMTMDQMRAKCRQLASREGLDLLFVDYVQLLNGNGRDGRASEIAQITRQLKLLAKELNITIVALSQLSRELERREDKRPILSDLRESGGIEQDADIVLFIYRDEVYNADVNPGVAELIVRKHRNGAIGTVSAAFLEQYARFDNLALGTEEPTA